MESRQRGWDSLVVVRVQQPALLVERSAAESVAFAGSASRFPAPPGAVVQALWRQPVRARADGFGPYRPNWVQREPRPVGCRDEPAPPAASAACAWRAIPGWRGSAAKGCSDPDWRLPGQELALLLLVVCWLAELVLAQPLELPWRLEPLLSVSGQASVLEQEPEQRELERRQQPGVQLAVQAVVLPAKAVAGRFDAVALRCRVSPPASAIGEAARVAGPELVMLRDSPVRSQ